MSITIEDLIGPTSSKDGKSKGKDKSRRSNNKPKNKDKTKSDKPKTMSSMYNLPTSKHIQTVSIATGVNGDNQKVLYKVTDGVRGKVKTKIAKSDIDLLGIGKKLSQYYATSSEDVNSIKENASGTISGTILTSLWKFPYGSTSANDEMTVGALIHTAQGEICLYDFESDGTISTSWEHFGIKCTSDYQPVKYADKSARSSSLAAIDTTTSTALNISKYAYVDDGGTPIEPGSSAVIDKLPLPIDGVMDLYFQAVNILKLLIDKFDNIRAKSKIIVAQSPAGDWTQLETNLMFTTNATYKSWKGRLNALANGINIDLSTYSKYYENFANTYIGPNGANTIDTCPELRFGWAYNNLNMVGTSEAGANLIIPRQLCKPLIDVAVQLKMLGEDNSAIHKEWNSSDMRTFIADFMIKSEELADKLSQLFVDLKTYLEYQQAKKQIEVLPTLKFKYPGVPEFEEELPRSIEMDQISALSENMFIDNPINANGSTANKSSYPYYLGYDISTSNITLRNSIIHSNQNDVLSKYHPTVNIQDFMSWGIAFKGYGFNTGVGTEEKVAIFNNRDMEVQSPLVFLVLIANSDASADTNVSLRTQASTFTYVNGQSSGGDLLPKIPGNVYLRSSEYSIAYLYVLEQMAKDLSLFKRVNSTASKFKLIDRNKIAVVKQKVTKQKAYEPLKGISPSESSK